MISAESCVLQESEPVQRWKAHTLTSVPTNKHCNSGGLWVMGKIEACMSFFLISVNGNYSWWYLSSECNVTCGQGVKIWRRSCDNPAPKNGGRNCTVLGEDVKYRICERRHCPSKFLYIFFSSSFLSWRNKIGLSLPYPFVKFSTLTYL